MGLLDKYTAKYDSVATHSNLDTSLVSADKKDSNQDVVKLSEELKQKIKKTGTDIEIDAGAEITDPTDIKSRQRTNLIDLEKAKDLALAGQDTLRTAALRGGATEAERREADIASRGLYRSGPAMRAAGQQEYAGKESLQEIAGKKRQIQKDYLSGKEEIEELKGDEVTKLEDARETFATDVVGNVLGQSADQVTALMGGLESIPEAHEAYGEYLTGPGRLIAPTGSGWGKGGDVPTYGSLQGGKRSEFHAPGIGGWFTDAEITTPGIGGAFEGLYSKAEKDVLGAGQFAEWIRQKSYTDPLAFSANITPSEEG